MLRASYRYPIISGAMLTQYRNRLASWTSLVCQPTRPATMPKQLLTLRDDSGPDELGVSLRSFGVNVWADTSLDAENLARDAAAATLAIPGSVPGLKAVRDVVGPYEIEDDPAFTFGGKPLTHFYFSFDGIVKAVSV